jgi:hypothetical protein
MSSDITSAAAALVGAAIGGLASFGSSWSTQWLQSRDKHLELERTRREGVFTEFIHEAARLYGDALSHQKDDIAALVRLYALVARIRLVSSPAVVEKAEWVLEGIARAYGAPNRKLQDLHDLRADGEARFLEEFSEACREELRALSLGRAVW